MTYSILGCDVSFDNGGLLDLEVLADLRRGDHHITAIVNTDLTDWLDRSRRAWWAQEGEPERPPFPDVRFLQPRRDKDGAYATAMDSTNEHLHELLSSFTERERAKYVRVIDRVIEALEFGAPSP